MEKFRQLEAVAVPLDGVNTDTDQIVPARYLQKPRANNFGDYLFRDVRRDPQGDGCHPGPDPGSMNSGHGLRVRPAMTAKGMTAMAQRADFPLNAPAYAKARILVAGRNFGCGSSREQAVWALVDGGFRAVIAPSFGDIFFSNSLKNGLLPVVLPQELVAALQDALRKSPGASVRIDLTEQTVAGPGIPPTRFAIDAFSRHCLLEGLDEIDYTLSQSARIQAYESGRANGTD